MSKQTKNKRTHENYLFGPWSLQYEQKSKEAEMLVARAHAADAVFPRAS